MKHAYLIMAHGNFEQLQFLVHLLDCGQNDIFIHIDKKTEICDLSLKTKYSAVTIFQKYKIYWGTYSQVECELFLLRQAIQGSYDYYHLLSGADMPLKNMKMINSFFEKNNGIEFVTVVSPKQYDAEVVRRAKYYHFFTRLRHTNFSIVNSFFTVVDRCSIVIQMFLRINRNSKYCPKVYYGPNWFSITNDCARYVIANERYIAKRFKFVNSADELFLQTLLCDSPYRSRLYEGVYSNLRFVKFSEDNRSSHPYLIDRSLLEIAQKSGCLFARKFDFDRFPDVKKSINEMFNGEL